MCKTGYGDCNQKAVDGCEVATGSDANNCGGCGIKCAESCSNGLCVSAKWTCKLSYYGTGDGCDCGCGKVDPDCSSALASACSYCDDDGSCAKIQGCGAINMTNNAVCKLGELDADMRHHTTNCLERRLPLTGGRHARQWRPPAPTPRSL